MIPQSEQGIKQWLDELEKHPLTAKMREDLAAKELAKRKDAARNIAALEKERDAIRELEKMKLLPTPNLQRIEELKKGMPDVNQYTEFESTKPLPGA